MNNKKVIVTLKELDEELRGISKDELEELIKKKEIKNRVESSKNAWIKRRAKYGNSGLSKEGRDKISSIAKELSEAREYLKKLNIKKSIEQEGGDFK